VKGNNQRRTLAELVSFFFVWFSSFHLSLQTDSHGIEGAVLTLMKRPWVNSLLPSPLPTCPAPSSGAVSGCWGIQSDQLGHE
jgi:hypothetical protein